MDGQGRHGFPLILSESPICSPRECLWKMCNSSKAILTREPRGSTTADSDE